MDEKIPSYKYKFKQIFKKIGQAKALDLFLLCCCSYLDGESEKQTHLCRTIELSDQRAVGLYLRSLILLSMFMVFFIITIELSDQRAVGL